MSKINTPRPPDDKAFMITVLVVALIGVIIVSSIQLLR